MKRIIINENTIKNIVSETLKNILKENYETVQYQHFDNDPKRYDSYVVCDCDGAIIRNYVVWPGDFWKEVLEDAIEDANDLSESTRGGTYYVFGCINNQYDDDTIVYTTDKSLNENNDRLSLISKIGDMVIEQMPVIDEFTSSMEVANYIEDIYVDSYGEYIKPKLKQEIMRYIGKKVF